MEAPPSPGCPAPSREFRKAAGESGRRLCAWAPMGRAAGWAVGLLMNCTLWRLGWSQRPGWYYGGLEAPFGKTLDPSQTPGDFALNSQALLWYAYWVILSMLAVIAVSSAGLFLQQFLRAQQTRGKVETTPRRSDPEEAALMEALHLLDAVMEKTWRHLHRLERRRRGRRGT